MRALCTSAAPLLVALISLEHADGICCVSAKLPHGPMYELIGFRWPRIKRKGFGLLNTFLVITVELIASDKLACLRARGSGIN